MFIKIVTALTLTSTLAQASSFDCRTPTGESFPATKARLEREVLLSGLRYAREHSHPVTGFVEDTVDNFADTAPGSHVRASISSTGFLMALIADLYTKRMVSRKEAYNYCRRPLLAVIQKKESDRTRGPSPDGIVRDISYKGWFSHFIDWSNGDRWVDSNTHKGVEYATTDSTWFFSGGIVCAEAFPSTDIPALFDKIFRDVDFRDLMTDGGAHPDKRTISMSYTPPDPAAEPGRSGYNKAQWDIYQHSWLVYLLGLGAPDPARRLPVEAWSAWRRTGETIDGHFLYGNRRALFSHYFPDVFMPPKDIQEKCGINYFQNSADATLFNRDTAAQQTESKTFQAGLWGLDAGPNPNPDGLVLGAPLSIGTHASTRYQVNSPYHVNGNACPACAVASAMFLPDLIFHDLQSWCDNKEFGRMFWGKYGPANGIDLDYGWISPISLSGIVGPMALSVANLDPNTSVWKLFRNYPAVRLGLVAASKAPLPAEGCFASEGPR
jgi:hypothetical protein